MCSSNTIKKVLCLIICFIFWFYNFPCFASRNGEQAIALLQNNNVVIDNIIQVDIINKNTEELLAGYNHYLPIVNDWIRAYHDFISSGGTVQKFRDLFRNSNVIGDARTLVGFERRLLELNALNTELRNAVETKNREHEVFLRELIEDHENLAQENADLTHENIRLNEIIRELESGNPICETLGYIDRSIRWSTCHCVNPDLAHRLPRKFWYGVASGTVITCVCLTVLYHFI